MINLPITQAILNTKMWEILWIGQTVITEEEATTIKQECEEFNKSPEGRKLALNIRINKRARLCQKK